MLSSLATGLSNEWLTMPARPRAPRQLVLLTGLKGLLGDCVLLGGTAELAQLR
jgi:hypothetical protein